MVEHRPLSDFIAYAILTLGVFIVVFPVYLALIASTHDAATVVGGHSARMAACSTSDSSTSHGSGERIPPAVGSVVSCA